MKHLGEKALVFFPSKTDLISITENGEVTEELLSERLEAINNKIEKQNLLKNVAQYTKENPLVYTFNKEFSITCTLESGKWYSLSFDYIGEISQGFDEVGFTYRGDNNDPNTWDDIDIINSSKVYYDDFYFQSRFSGEYTFYWNMFDENNKNTKIYNLKVVEGYSPEMVRTVEEIKKINKSKLENVDNTADKDKFVKGLIDASDTNGTRHIFANWAGNSELAISNVQYFTTLSAKNKDSEIRPLSVAKTKTVLGVDTKQNITNGTVTTDTDWNTLTTAGTYKIQNCNMTEANHAPVGKFPYGTLLVLKSENAGEQRTVQLFFEASNGSGNIVNSNFFVRNSGYGNGAIVWSNWVSVLTEDSGVKKSGDTMTGTLTAPLFSGPIQGKKGGASIFLNDVTPLDVAVASPEGVCVWYAIGGNKYDIQRINAVETKNFLEINNVNNTADNEKYVKGVVDQAMSAGYKITFSYVGRGYTSFKDASYLLAYDATDYKNIKVRPISIDDLANKLGVPSYTLLNISSDSSTNFDVTGVKVLKFSGIPLCYFQGFLRATITKKLADAAILFNFENKEFDDCVLENNAFHQVGFINFGTGARGRLMLQKNNSGYRIRAYSDDGNGITTVANSKLFIKGSFLLL